MTRPSAGLRRSAHDRAGGQCEYCGIQESCTFLPHQIDHIVPEQHGGSTTEDNLALSCALYNRRKGRDMASVDLRTGHLTALFNPRRQIWREHFTVQDGLIVPLSAEGRVTATLLQLNDPQRVEERRALIRAGAYTPPGPVQPTR